MQTLEQALRELEDLHQKVFGRPAPELGARPLAPFPPGVDPLKHTLHEVQRLKEIADQVAFAPRPGCWVPAMDSFLIDDEFVVRLDVPGVSREDIEVFVVDGECIVRGDRKPPHGKSPLRPLALERASGPFERRFVAPHGTDLTKIKARTVDGVLELRIPVEVTEPAKEHRIEVV